MKNWFFAIAGCILFLNACKDTSPPGFVSILINGETISTTLPQQFAAGVNETITFQIRTSDDEELLQLIAYIDTTGLMDRERLYADGLEGTEAFSEFTMSMRSIDSLSQRHFFGLQVPVSFTVSDNNQNTSTVTIPILAL